MIVNEAAIRAIQVNLQTSFTEALAAVPPDQVLDALSMEIAATTGTQKFPMGALLVTIREWLGDRVHQNIAAYLQTVEVRDFEATVDVHENHIQDDQLALYTPTVQSLADEANLQWHDLAIECIDERGWDADFPIFDAQPLFSASHVFAGSDVDVQSNLTTENLDEDAVYAGLAAMLAYRRPNGKFFRSRPTHFLHAAGLQATVDRLFRAPTLANGASNPLYGKFADGNIIAVQEFAAQHWMMADGSRRVRPIVRVNRQPVRWTAVVDPKAGGAPFETKTLSFGLDMRRCVVAPAWWEWYGSDGSEGD